MKAIKNLMTLETVQIHFEDWRNMKNGRGRIPETLWSEALSLLPNYPLTHVAKALRISSKTLSQKEQKVSSHSFIQIELSKSQELNQPQLSLISRIEIEKNDGAKLYLIPSEAIDLSAVIHSFLEG
jgi:hypothetical protein